MSLISSLISLLLFFYFFFTFLIYTHAYVRPRTENWPLVRTLKEGAKASPAPYRRVISKPGIYSLFSILYMYYMHKYTTKQAHRDTIYTIIAIIKKLHIRSFYSSISSSSGQSSVYQLSPLGHSINTSNSVSSPTVSCTLMSIDSGLKL